MNTRDTRQDQHYWDDSVRFLEDAITEESSLAATARPGTDRRRRLTFSVYQQQLELLISRYSRGDDAEELRDSFPAVAEALDVYLQAKREAEGDESHFFDFPILETYVHALWLVSLAFLLDVSGPMVDHVVALVDNAQKDALFDRLVALCFPNRAIADRLVHPRPYEYLYRALDAEGPVQQELISRFLKGYYRGMRHVYWHDAHLLPDAGYFGYWCFELAAFVKALGIPDDSFADNVYYPRDLVHVHAG